jgi:hypothetical protein
MEQAAPISVNYGEHFQKGISFEQYVVDFEKSLNLGDQVFNYQYLPLNWQRSQRILKHFEVAASTQEVMKNVERPIQWLLITEPWCGDASQIVPVIAKIAEASAGKIDLRLVYRDQHLGLMDAHLTNGGRSIPKLLQLDEHGNFQKAWGPRPVAAQEMVIALKSNPETAPKYADELHKWYAQNKQQAIVSEIEAFLGE